MGVGLMLPQDIWRPQDEQQDGMGWTSWTRGEVSSWLILAHCRG